MATGIALANLSTRHACKERKSEMLELPAHTLLPRQSQLGPVL